jgi:hypothetical protein
VAGGANRSVSRATSAVLAKGSLAFTAPLMIPTPHVRRLDDSHSRPRLAIPPRILAPPVNFVECHRYQAGSLLAPTWFVKAMASGCCEKHLKPA